MTIISLSSVSNFYKKTFFSEASCISAHAACVGYVVLTMITSVSYLLMEKDWQFLQLVYLSMKWHRLHVQKNIVLSSTINSKEVKNHALWLKSSINGLSFTRVAHNSLVTNKPVAIGFPIDWNLEVLVFVEGGKPENLEKNPRSKNKY